jgi:ankyrin repeat protein
MAAQGTRRAANTLEVYKYLIEELKQNAKTTDSDGNTLLHLIARKQNQTDVAEYLYSKGLNVNSTNKEGSNVLMVAAGGRDMDFIHLVLDKTTNINATNQKGESALTSAVTSGISETIELLLSKNADIQVKDVRGNHLGYYLIQSYRPARPGFGPAGAVPAKDEFSEKMNILQTKGLNLALPQTDKSTLYHLAAQKDDLNLIKKLAGLHIDVNAKNAEEMTVLHKVALTAHDDKILKYLLSIGAKKDIETEFGETAYDLAAQNEYLKNNKVDISFLK